MSDYWRDHAEIAAAEAGLPGLTDKQLEAIAGVMESAHEFYGQSHGHDVASANFAAERERERKAGWEAAERERNKVHCRVCNGEGRERYSAGPWAVDTQCYKCNGEGRHDP